MPAPKTAFDEICAELADTNGAKASKMFGVPCIKVEGKAIASLNDDAMVFKLRGKALEEALSLPGAQHFDPMGGRPMREWIEVPASSSEQWPELAREALEYLLASR